MNLQETRKFSNYLMKYFIETRELFVVVLLIVLWRPSIWNYILLIVFSLIFYKFSWNLDLLYYNTKSLLNDKYFIMHL